MRWMPDAAFLGTFRRQCISRTVLSGSDPCWDEYGDSYTLDYGDACAVVLLPQRFALLPIRICHSLLGTFLARQLFPGRVVRYWASVCICAPAGYVLFTECKYAQTVAFWTNSHRTQLVQDTELRSYKRMLLKYKPNTIHQDHVLSHMLSHQT